MWNDFPSFPTCIFLFVASSLLANSHILRSVRWPLTEPLTVIHARDHWWTLDFAKAAGKFATAVQRIADARDILQKFENLKKEGVKFQLMILHF
jgi:hypothetical protein